MCGRFALSATTKDIEKLKPGLKVKTEIKPKFNISPTQSVAIIKGGDETILDSAHWGLIPSWAKDKSIGVKMFNARAETIDEKPSFRSAFKSRRCIIPATEFYEWKKIEGSSKKQPYRIKLLNNSIFFFAGLWENWIDADSASILSTTIITTEPNSLMEEIHNRMPVILNESSIDIWLNQNIDTHQLKSILIPYSSDEMVAETIDSNYLSNRINDGFFHN